MTNKSQWVISISSLLALFSPPFLYVLMRFGAHGKMMGFLFTHMWLKTCLGQMLIYINLLIIDWLANEPDNGGRHTLFALAYGGFLVNWLCAYVVIKLLLWSVGSKTVWCLISRCTAKAARADKRSNHDEGSGTGL
jgi:hypothetical protein